jgi:hypothetical protein
MSKEKWFWLFIVFWIAQSILTAVFTELYFDEAYYWMYSQFPDWGYFDHPPGVAIMIWLGSFLGKTELAVRILNILLMAASIWLIYRLTKPEKTGLFCLTVFSFLSLHISGFVSLPDTPFFFFALLFMLAYKNFLQKESAGNMLFLGAAAALMLYSKYHGSIVILFVVLSNPRLLLNLKFYLAGFVGILLFLPHIWWQVSHNFPSLQYHLVDRAASTYRLNHTLEYVAGNLPYHAGLVSVALFIASFFYKTSDKWERALQWNLYGTLLFFFLITFKGQRIEPNWTLFIIFPLIYLGYRSVENSKWQKPYGITAGIFAGILLLLKVHLMFPLGVLKKDRVWDFHLNKIFARQVEAIAGNNMIVANDYKTASLLNFYTRKDYYIPALNINSRANQYSIWQLDSLVCNRDVAYVNNHIEGREVRRGMFKKAHVATIQHVSSPAALALTADTVFVENDSLQISLAAIQQYGSACTFTDTLLLEFRLFQEEGLPRIDSLPLPAQRTGTGFHTYTLPAAKGLDKISVKVLSTKLEGGPNNFLLIEAGGNGL